AKEFYILVTGLSTLQKGATSDHLRQLAILQLKAIEKLGDSLTHLSPQDQYTIRLANVVAQKETGNTKEALLLLENLTQSFPKSLAAQALLAETLQQTNTAPNLAASLDKFRQLTHKCRPNTEPWFRAKYGVARTLLLQGKKEEAAQRIQYLQLTSSALKTSTWNDRFGQLLLECQNK
ncbi:MAG: hypothetical protein MPJ24_11330, partial [Pirellulaceae bacterium]|nr:hypothetical protein [Pirellulaceae bacterium]